LKILEFKNVSYKAKDDTILNKISFAVNQGDFITITGPSGSGKTTLIRLINGLISPSEGVIFYNGRELSSYEPVELRKKVVLAFQMPYLFGNTVYDNLSFPFTVRGMSPNKDLMAEKLKILNLSKDFITKDIRNLSGGEKQRIALARSLVFKPEMLLLDEVTSALDPENTALVESIISNLSKEGVTILWITHNPKQAVDLGCRNMHIENGQIMEEKS
jgi:putative ABC transport system ATP-binding protein